MLDSDEVNAFSHVGGHVYVSWGVFTLAQTDAELEFVVAHELAHAELGHAAARAEQLAPQADAAIGRVPGLHFLIALGYSAEQEFAADAWAYQALGGSQIFRTASPSASSGGMPVMPPRTACPGTAPRGLAPATRGKMSRITIPPIRRHRSGWSDFERWPARLRTYLRRVGETSPLEASFCTHLTSF